VYDNTGPPISATEELVPNSWSTANPVTVQSVGCVACKDSGKPCQFTIHLGHVKVINATIALRLHDPSTLQSVSLSNFKADPLKYIAILGGEVKEEDVEHTRLAGRHRASSPSNGLGDHGIHFPTAGSSLAGKRKGHESDGTRSIDTPLKRARPDRPMFIDVSHTFLVDGMQLTYRPAVMPPSHTNIPEWTMRLHVLSVWARPESVSNVDYTRNCTTTILPM